MPHNTPASDDGFWEMYWEMRLRPIETLGKREAILAASRLIRQMAKGGQAVRLLELGSGEAQIIGALAEGHAQVPGIETSVGVDYLHRSIEVSRHDYPALRFVEGDFTDPALLEPLGQFQILLLVNALHEVFSTTFSEALGEVDVPRAKQRVEQALGLAVQHLAPGGWVVLFDGLEPEGDPRMPVRLRFLHLQAREHFETFAREYHPFHITYRSLDRWRVELPLRDFTRYITKSIFLGKKLWLSERFESYQYFTLPEFRAAFARQGLTIRDLRTLTVDEEKWRSTVEIETPGVYFPNEHLMMMAQKAVSDQLKRRKRTGAQPS